MPAIRWRGASPLPGFAWRAWPARRGVDAWRVRPSALQREAGKRLPSPSSRRRRAYERLAAGARPEEWLKCAVIEQFEKLRHFSSMYSGTTSHLVLEPIRDLPFRSPEMDRRWELVRMKSGGRGAGTACRGALHLVGREPEIPNSGPVAERALLDAARRGERDHACDAGRHRGGHPDAGLRRGLHRVSSGSPRSRPSPTTV